MDVFKIFGEDDLRALPRGLWGIREPELEYMGRTRPTGQYPVRTLRAIPFRPEYPLTFLFLSLSSIFWPCPTHRCHRAMHFSGVRAKH